MKAWVGMQAPTVSPKGAVLSDEGDSIWTCAIPVTSHYR